MYFSAINLSQITRYAVTGECVYSCTSGDQLRHDKEEVVVYNDGMITVFARGQFPTPRVGENET